MLNYYGCLNNVPYKVNSYKPGVLLCDIGKQNSPTCDAAERGVPSEGIPSGAILFA